MVKKPLTFIFYSPVAFEKWDFRNSIEKGIGGSETSHVEMAWRLAKRGHKVITYAPIPDDCPPEWRNTQWFDIKKADFTQEGIWILYRCPSIVDKFPPLETREVQGYNQQLWLLMQDWDYPNWTPKRIKNTDLIITLCKAHGKDVIQKHPLIKENMWLTSNGIKTDLMDEVSKENIQRNPKKIIYASSPDRGLKQALKIFKKAREYDSELELYAFYGFNNLDKLIKNTPQSALAKTKKEITELLKQPGVHFMGRISQVELYRQWLSSGIWLYCTNFAETSCITSMEAQAMGAIPLFSPAYAQRENVRFGVAIEGNADDVLIQAKFAAELVRMTSKPFSEEYRKEMMLDAINRFNWENFVTQWENKAYGEEYKLDFPEQLTKDDF